MCSTTYATKYAIIKNIDERIKALKQLDLNKEFHPWCTIWEILHQLEDETDNPMRYYIEVANALYEGSGSVVIDGYASFNISQGGFMSIMDSPDLKDCNCTSRYNPFIGEALAMVGFKTSKECGKLELINKYNDNYEYWM